MNYKNLNVKWRVYKYDEETEDQTTVKIFENPMEAAKFCIDHWYAGVEMIAFPANKKST